MKPYEKVAMNISRDAKVNKRGLFEHLNEVRKGNSLRRTFVDIGLSILDRRAGMDLKLEVYRTRKNRIKNFNRIFFVCIFLFVCGLIIYPCSKKLFGKRKVRYVPKIELTGAQSALTSRFAITFMREFASLGDKGISRFWSGGIPPTQKELYLESLNSMNNPAGLKPVRVWSYKNNRKVIYVECAGFGCGKLKLGIVSRPDGGFEVISLSLS